MSENENFRQTALLRLYGLEARGFDIKVAASARGAADALKTERPDVILVDPRLRGQESDEVLVEVLARVPGLPVIALVEDMEAAREASRLGVEECIFAGQLSPAVLERSILHVTQRPRTNPARMLAGNEAQNLRSVRELERAKSQFFNSAAHELGTPLTPIKLQLHLLMTGDQETLTPLQRKSLEIIDRNVDRLSRLAQDLLDVARLQAGHLRLNVQWSDVNLLVGKVVRSFEPLAASQGVRLFATDDRPTRLEVDAARLSQVLHSLVSNALKFTPRGGRIHVERAENDREVIILVHDTGAGLTREQIGHLFQPFSEVHDNARAFGTGLGLFVSRGIVELHGGRLWCESPGPGQGATFGLSLPKRSGPASSNGDQGSAFLAAMPPMASEPS